jgi:hypothetical protein
VLQVNNNPNAKYGAVVPYGTDLQAAREEIRITNDNLRPPPIASLDDLAGDWQNV